MVDWLEELRAAAAAAVPPWEGELDLPGLDEPVEVLRDEHGIAHIRAASLEDLFRAQGFVVASERLFQLEFLLRAANGRLAGMVGEPALAADRFARTVGWHRAGARIWDSWDERSRRIVRAYLEGARAWLQAMPAPPAEYVALGLAPSLPQDGPSWAAASAWMSWNLSGNFDEELVRAEVAERLGPEAVRDLFPELPDVRFPIAGRRPTPNGLDLLDAAPPRPPGQGSNEWVVAASRSATGAPLLAGDPHLAVLVPSFWFACHLQAPGYEAAGVALPFAPGIVIGRTPHHAWGLTNVGGDTQDLYLERLDETGSAARFRDAWEPLTVHQEPIEVRGREEPLVLEVRETRHGPILDAYVVGVAQPEIVEGAVQETYALRWVGASCAIAPIELVRMAQATDFSSFREALRGWLSPGQNVVYADADGQIGYQCTGRYPIRRGSDGSTPVPGWDGQHEWEGWIPFEELPFHIDPPEGFLATANNRIHEATYPHLIGVDWTPPSRIRRIGELLEAETLHSVQSFAAMQVDVVSVPARELASVLGALEPLDARQQAALELLRGWDGSLDVDSAAACVYAAWCHHIAERTLRPALGERLFTHAYGRSTSIGRWRAVVLPHLLANPTARWFGADGEAGRDAVLRAALDDALDELEAKLGPDPAAWRWGDLHRVVFASPLAALPGLGELFTAGVVPQGGDDDTVLQGAYEPERRYDAVVVPSCRQIHDLSSPDGSSLVHAPGQSGHPASGAWSDLLPLWASGERVPLLLSPEAVRRSARHRLELRPTP